MLVILENAKSDHLDAFIPYLAMNHFDRFISRNPLPNVLGRVRDDIVLVANCCLMLAWKMRRSTFNVLEFLVKTNMIEHQQHIPTVVLAILSGLNWKMRAVTAIRFVDMFARRNPMARRIKHRTMNQIIIQAQGDITYAKFKPSVIAAAALLAACKLRYGEVYDLCYDLLLGGDYLKEDDLNACYEKTYAMCLEKQILMETDRQEHMPQTAQVGGASIPETSSSFSHRPGKEPMQELSEPVPVPKSENDSDMNFELKWILGSTDTADFTIHSPLFRPVSVAAETTQLENEKGLMPYLERLKKDKGTRKQLLDSVGRYKETYNGAEPFDNLITLQDFIGHFLRQPNVLAADLLEVTVEIGLGYDDKTSDEDMLMLAFTTWRTEGLDSTLDFHLGSASSSDHHTSVERNEDFVKTTVDYANSWRRECEELKPLVPILFKRLTRDYKEKQEG